MHLPALLMMAVNVSQPHCRTFFNIYHSFLVIWQSVSRKIFFYKGPGPKFYTPKCVYHMYSIRHLDERVNTKGDIQAYMNQTTAIKDSKRT